METTGIATGCPACSQSQTVLQGREVMARAGSRANAEQDFMGAADSYHAKTAHDSILIGRIAAGDEDALADLYERYAGALYGVLLRILKDSREAEEELEELFLQVWRGAGEFDAAGGMVGAWLLAMGRHRAVRRLRARRPGKVVKRTEEFPREELSSPLNLQDEGLRGQVNGRLREALASLPLKEKQAWELACFEGMSLTEIAARTGSSRETVRSRVRAAMRAIKLIF
jgi:RNA polymerase sigma-70 factor (ECF subfamily)